MRNLNNKGKVNGLLLGNVLVVIGVIYFIFSYVGMEVDNTDNKEYILLMDVRNILNVDLDKSDYDKCNLDEENYLFLGDSITYRYDLGKYFSWVPVVNSGVEGNKTSDILSNIKDRVYVYNPTKVFLLIGTNQLEEESAEEIFEGIIEIVSLIKQNRSGASIYIESIYPVNHNFKKSPAKDKENDEIREINEMIKEYSKHHNVYYIDVYSHLCDDEGNLRKEYSIDGLHLSDEGYDKVTDILKKYVKE